MTNIAACPHHGYDALYEEGTTDYSSRISRIEDADIAYTGDSDYAMTGDVPSAIRCYSTAAVSGAMCLFTVGVWDKNEGYWVWQPGAVFVEVAK